MLTGLEFMCEIQWARPGVAPYAAALGDSTGVEQITLSCNTVTHNGRFIYIYIYLTLYM